MLQRYNPDATNCVCYLINTTTENLSREFSHKISTQMGDGAGCDHSAIGDAKLLNAQALAVEPANKLPTIWGHLKDSY